MSSGFRIPHLVIGVLLNHMQLPFCRSKIIKYQQLQLVNLLHFINTTYNRIICFSSNIILLTNIELSQLKLTTVSMLYAYC